MKTIVYITRHSKPFRDLIGNYDVLEEEQIRNEKNPLSVEGEIRAHQMSLIDELKDVEILYSSHYVRAMSTAKYIATKNNIKLNVDYRFGERKFGVNSMSELPIDFFENQFKDWNYKIGNGECLNEVSIRMKDALLDLLKKVTGQTSMIVSHGTALSVMLKNWCELKLNEESKLVEIYFNNKLVFDGNWNAPELFKLTFEDNNLIDLKNIEIKY